jgi:hypothetical protein
MANLKADFASKTPKELLRRYLWHLIALVIAAALILSFTYEFFGVLFVAMLYCCFLGTRNPETFRPLFKDKTSKANIGWTFAFFAFVFGSICANLDPQSGGSSASLPMATTQQNGADPTGRVARPVPSAPTGRQVPAKILESKAKPGKNANRSERTEKGTGAGEGATAREGGETPIRASELPTPNPFLIPNDATSSDTRAGSESGQDNASVPKAALPTSAPALISREWMDIPGTGKRQVGRFFGVEYVVLSVEKVTAIEETRADDTFFLVDMAAANSNKRTTKVDAGKIVLLDDKGREFERSDDGSSALRSADRTRNIGMYSQQVSPGLIKRFTLVFDAPSDSQGLRLRVPDAYLFPIDAPDPRD